MASEELNDWLGHIPPRPMRTLPTALTAQIRRQRRELILPLSLLLPFVAIAGLLGGPVGAGGGLALTTAALWLLWRAGGGALVQALEWGPVAEVTVQAARRIKVLTARPPALAGLELELRQEGHPPAWVYLWEAPPPPSAAHGRAFHLLRAGRSRGLLIGLSPGIHPVTLWPKPDHRLETVPE